MGKILNIMKKIFNLRKLLKYSLIIFSTISIVVTFFTLYELFFKNRFVFSYEGLIFFLSLFKPFTSIYTITLIVLASYLASQQNFITSQATRNTAYFSWNISFENCLKSIKENSYLQGILRANSYKIFEFLFQMDYQMKETKDIIEFYNSFIKDQTKHIIAAQNIGNNSDPIKKKNNAEVNIWRFITMLCNTGTKDLGLYETFLKEFNKDRKS